MTATLPSVKAAAIANAFRMMKGNPVALAASLELAETAPDELSGIDMEDQLEDLLAVMRHPSGKDALWREAETLGLDPGLVTFEARQLRELGVDAVGAHIFALAHGLAKRDSFCDREIFAALFDVEFRRKLLDGYEMLESWKMKGGCNGK